MALSGTDRGSGSTNTGSQSTLVVTPASNLAAGSLAVLCVAYDNSGTLGADPFASISDNSGAGNTWTSRQAPLNDPGAANAGQVLRIFTCRLKAALTTSHSITVDFGGIVTVARSWTLMEVTAAAGKGAVYQTGGNTTGSSTGPTITSGSITSGDMIIGAMGAEGNAAITGDSDTSNGSWSAQQTSGVGTTTGGSEISSQRKVVTGTAAQTYNLTITTADWCIAWIQLREVSDTTVTPGVATLATTSFAPTARTPVTVTPGTKALATSSFAPSVNVGGVVLYDSFTDSNGTFLENHTSESGATYTKHLSDAGGEIVINSNRLTKDASASAAVVYASPANLGSDFVIEARFICLSYVDMNAGILFCVQTGADSYYNLRYNQGNNLFEFRLTNASGVTGLGTYSDSFPASESRRIRIQKRGSVFNIWIDDTLRFENVSDSTFSTGRVGIRMAGAASTSTGLAIGELIVDFLPVIATPSTATLSITTYAPTVRRGTISVPAKLSLSLTSFAPKLLRTVIVPVKALTLSSFAPRLALSIVPPKVSLTLSQFAPRLGSQAVPTTKSLATTTFAPTLRFTVIAGNRALTISAFTPSIIRLAPTFPATSVLDNFNRANEGPPPSSNWTTGIANDLGGFTRPGHSVVSNQIANEFEDAAQTYWNAAQYGPDCEAYITVSDSSGLLTLSLAARLTNIGRFTCNGYAVQIEPGVIGSDRVYHVFRIDSGAFTQLAIASEFGIGGMTGDKYGIRISGDLIELLGDTGSGWEVKLSTNDSTYSSAGFIGIATDSDSLTRWDDFGGGSLTVTVTVTPDTQTSSLTTFAPVLKVVVTPGTLSLSATTLAPTVATTGNATVTPSKLSLTTTKFAPVLATTVIPATKALSISTFAPVLSFSVVPATKNLSLATFGPSLATATIPATKNLSLSSFAPSVINAFRVVPSTQTLTTATFAPMLALLVVPSTASLSITTFAPTNAFLLSPSARALSLSTFAPSVTATANVSVVPNTASISLSTLSVRLSETTTPQTKSLSLTTFAPSVTASANVTVVPSLANLTTSHFAVTLRYSVITGTKSLTLTTLAPTVTTPVTVTPATRSLTLSTVGPTLRLSVIPPTRSFSLVTFAASLRHTIIPATRALTTFSFAPTVIATHNLTVTPAPKNLSLATSSVTLTFSIVTGTRALTLTSFAPEITANVTVAPSTRSLTLTTFAPRLAGTIKVAPVALSLSGFAPSIAVRRTITPTPASLALVKFRPSLAASIRVATRSLTISTFGLQLRTTVKPATLALTGQTYGPHLATRITAQTIGLSLVTFAPSVQGLTIVISPIPAELVTAGYSPDVIAFRPRFTKLIEPENHTLRIADEDHNQLISREPWKTVEVPREIRTKHV
jgi:hypothetical protein